MTLIAIIVTLLYLSLIGSLIYGFDKVENFYLKDLKPKTKFSVVIPFRNESENLSNLLRSISQLNFPPALFEVILVDDASEDDSTEIIKSIFNKKSFVKIDIRWISNERKTKSPKKDAITKAISIARHDWIVTTDADCILPKFWLDSFDEFIQQNPSELIVAPVTYAKTNTFLDRFQLLDVLSLQGSTIGGFGIGKPFLCNGANLAYTKELFESVHGFAGNTDIASGDDIFMLEKTLSSHPNKVNYLKCEQAIIRSKPQPNMDSLISQRVRWASKTGAYKNLLGKIAAIIVFLMNGGLLVFSLMALVGILKLKTFAYLLIIKFGIDFLLIYKTANFMNQKDVLKSYFIAFFLYPFFSSFVVFISIFRGYKWKGRSYRR